MPAPAGAREFLLPRDHGLFRHCHGSTVVALPSGDKLVAFFAGTREGAGDTAIWLSRQHDGEWQTPVRLMAEPGLAHWNPVLHADGPRLWLFYKVGPTVHRWTTRVATSNDAGVTWSQPRPLVEGDVSPRGPVRNKLLVLTDGCWLAPGSTEDDRVWDAFVDRSRDEGRTWQRSDVPIVHRTEKVPPGHVTTGHETAGQGAWRGLADHVLWETDPARTFAWDGVIQPTLFQSSAAGVHMLLRSTRGWVYRSDSADSGRTWCPAYATTLPNNNSGLDVVRLLSGQLVLACNPVAGNWGRRTPLVLMVSADDGGSWADAMALETEEGEFSYPAIIAAGGWVHVTYTWNRANIVHRRIAIADLAIAGP
jgi:predicted neuraminidase